MKEVALAGLDADGSNDPTALSPRQARIVAQLARLVGQGAADFFRDACQMLAETPPHRSATHLISHALRETDSALRYVLGPLTVPGAANLENGAGSKGKSGRDKGGKGKQSNDGHISSIMAVCEVLELSPDHPAVVFWQQQAGKTSANLAGRAHRNALERARPLNGDFKGFFAQIEELFDMVLERFEERYARVFDRLDLLLASEPSAALADELKQRLPANPVTRQRFFSRAPAAWIGPLTEKGFFRFPPEPRLDPVDGNLDMPSWPESEYLARVAAEVPGDAVQAVLGMAPTENSRVVWDLTRLALAVSPDHAVLLAPTLAAAIPGRYGVIAADQVGELAARLADDGHPSSAMDLLRAVLADIPSRDVAGVRSYDYVQVLRVSVPVVARAVGAPVVALLIDRLSRAASTDRPNRSQLWRPAIEPDPDQRRDTDARNALVDALIGIGVALHDAGVHPVQDTVAALADDGPDILRRIRLHLLQLRGHDAPDLVVAQLRGLARRVDDAIEREYLLLTAASQAWMEPSAVAGLRATFDQDPDTSEWAQRLARHTDGDDGDSVQQLLQQRVDRWRRDRLAALEPRLDDDRRARYEALVAQYGPAPDLSVPPQAVFTVWSGADVDAAELQSLTAAALVQFLRDWQPQQDWRQLDRSSIRPALAVAAQAESGRWSSDAAAFVGLPSEYVTSILDGFWQAASAGERLDWTGLATFLTWVDSEALAELTVGVTRRRARLWRTARYGVMRLFTVDSTADPDRIPAAAEPALWSIISAACTDPDPHPDDASDEPQGSELAAALLDAVRPEALRAAILYGLRAQRRTGTSDVPEVMEVLDAHVAAESDPALAVRGMFGQRLQTLLRLNPDWTASHLDSILPAVPEQAGVWRVAWNGHLSNQVVTDAAWALLRPHYRRAVDLLNPATTDEWEQARAQQLALHLGNRFWFGQLDLDDPDRLLQRFYERAPTEATSTIIDTAGRSLHRDEPLEAERRDRLMRLWDYRVAAVRHGSDPAELSSFNVWFASGQFDDAWSLEQLHDALELVPDLDLGVHVLRRLHTLAAAHPHACLQVLQRMVGNRDRYWNVSRHQPLIHDIIAVAAAAGDDVAAGEARRLVSAFAIDGFDFRGPSTLNPAP